MKPLPRVPKWPLKVQVVKIAEVFQLKTLSRYFNTKFEFNDNLILPDECMELDLWM